MSTLPVARESKEVAEEVKALAKRQKGGQALKFTNLEELEGFAKQVLPHMVSNLQARPMLRETLVSTVAQV